MTMTDTEAKALALVNADYMMWTADNITTLVAGFKAMRAREAATEARHAAELLELKERFSEAMGQITDLAKQVEFSLGSGILTRIQSIAAPFIIPAPDPLVEALREAYDAAVAELGEDYIRKLSWFPSARKIGEAE